MESKEHKARRKKYNKYSVMEFCEIRETRNKPYQLIAQERLKRMQKRPQMITVKPSKNYLAYNKNIDIAVNMVEKRLGLILFIVLHDKFDWGQDKVANLGEKVTDLKRRWIAGEIDTAELEGYALRKKYDLYAAAKNIPMSHKMALAKNKNKIVPGVEIYLNKAFFNIFLIMFKALKDNYRFYRPQFETLYKYVCQYVGEYATGHVNDAIIIESIKEYGYNPVTGEKA